MTKRIEQVRAAVIQPGDVLDNVSRLFVVESAWSNGRDVEVTYRYTDDRSIVRRDTMRVARQSVLRVRTEADPDLVDGILAATVGLPR